MGAIHFSLNPGLAKLFKESLALEVFVETGTFQGDSLEIAAGIFPESHSVEYSKSLYDAACLRFAGAAGIRLWHGDSPEQLRKIKSLLAGRPALFWLDAHWCVAEGTSGEEAQCPLLAELDVLLPCEGDDVILIDDARYFLAPPPPPNDSEHWPHLGEILARFHKIERSHSIIVLNDVICFFPKRIQGKVFAFSSAENSDLLALRQAADASKMWQTMAEEKEVEIQRLLSKTNSGGKT